MAKKKAKVKRVAIPAGPYYALPDDYEFDDAWRVQAGDRRTDMWTPVASGMNKEMARLIASLLNKNAGLTP
jgi:hypothetical protein